MPASNPQKILYLTFDDGPHEPYTSQLLDVLKQHNIRATFFLCGKNVEQFPNVSKRVITEGHAVGNHSYSHSMLKTYLGIAQKDNDRGAAVITAVTGITPRLFRPPWGLNWPWIKRHAQKSGQTTYHWNVSAFDWWQPPVPFMVHTILFRIKPGDIILLHDGDQTRRRQSRTKTIEAVKILIPEFQRRSFIFKTLLEHP